MTADRSSAPDVRRTPRSTNASLDRVLAEEAHSHDVTAAQAYEQGIADQLTRERAAQWLEENRAALDSYNAYVEAHGLPLAKYRLF